MFLSRTDGYIIGLESMHHVFSAVTILALITQIERGENTVGIAIAHVIAFTRCRIDCKVVWVHLHRVRRLLHIIHAVVGIAHFQLDAITAASVGAHALHGTPLLGHLLLQLQLLALNYQLSLLNTILPQLLFYFFVTFRFI